MYYACSTAVQQGLRELPDSNNRHGIYLASPGMSLFQRFGAIPAILELGRVE